MHLPGIYYDDLVTSIFLTVQVKISVCATGQYNVTTMFEDGMTTCSNILFLGL